LRCVRTTVKFLWRLDTQGQTKTGSKVDFVAERDLRAELVWTGEHSTRRRVGGKELILRSCVLRKESVEEEVVEKEGGRRHCVTLKRSIRGRAEQREKKDGANHCGASAEGE